MLMTGSEASTAVAASIYIEMIFVTDRCVLPSALILWLLGFLIHDSVKSTRLGRGIVTVGLPRYCFHRLVFPVDDGSLGRHILLPTPSPSQTDL